MMIQCPSSLKTISIMPIMPIILFTNNNNLFTTPKQILIIELTELELLIFIIIVITIMILTFSKNPNKDRNRNKTL